MPKKEQIASLLDLCFTQLPEPQLLIWQVIRTSDSGPGWEFCRPSECGTVPINQSAHLREERGITIKIIIITNKAIDYTIDFKIFSNQQLRYRVTFTILYRYFAKMILCTIWHRSFSKTSDFKQREEFVSVGTKDNFAILPQNQQTTRG